jgi:hypothetical protein
MIKLTDRAHTAYRRARQAKIALSPSFALLSQIVMLYYTDVFVSFHWCN